ncbi:MAG: hypothetical protein K9J37_21710 [Saprospiraceae bacterium]|nr:hypothetical protein [Saprospiraceae bacterium]MCF8282579.1 hypothetical protein [Bacteroidales bacterium]MCF8310785.1 hypothetical protein [Saprospiraceae bacterium]
MFGIQPESEGEQEEKVGINWVKHQLALHELATLNKNIVVLTTWALALSRPQSKYFQSKQKKNWRTHRTFQNINTFPV